MLSFLGALFFSILTFPIWVAISLIWASLKIIYQFFKNTKWLIENTILMDESMRLDATNTALTIIFIPFRAIYEGIISLNDIPIWLWGWARYDHPLIAFIISLGLAWFYTKLIYNKN